MSLSSTVERCTVLTSSLLILLGYGKDKVSVYIMSGIDGVGDLPKEHVTCHFTKNSFDLKVRPDVFVFDHCSSCALHPLTTALMSVCVDPGSSWEELPVRLSLSHTSALAIHSLD